jgi:hypothetical protein
MRKLGMTARKTCPPGMKMRVATMRKAYTKQSGAKVPGMNRRFLDGVSAKRIHGAIVPPACIPKRGRKGKPSSVRIILDDEHILSEHGYADVVNMTKEARMTALKKMAEHYIPIKGETATWTFIIRALNARYVLNRNTNPQVAAIMKSDQKTISSMYRKLKASQKH